MKSKKQISTSMIGQLVTYSAVTIESLLDRNCLKADQSWLRPTIQHTTNIGASSGKNLDCLRQLRSQYREYPVF